MCLLPACIVAAVLSAPVDAWPRFRGPNGQGTATAAFPTSWKAADYRWRVELPGKGHSSPAVWGDRLYITSALDDATLVVQCLKTADGGEVWRRTFPSKTHPKNNSNSFASSTPAVDDARAYIAWAWPEHYYVAALDRQTGKELWRHDMGAFDAEHGFGTSPIVVDGLVILTNEQNGPSNVVALDAATGKPRWTTPRRTEKAAYSTPCLFEPAGGKRQLILTSWAHGFSAVDPASGKPLWELPVFKWRVVGSPLAAGDLVIGTCGGGGQGKQAIAVRPAADGSKAEVAFEVALPVPYVPTPLSDGRLIFLLGDAGVSLCLELKTGKVFWRERMGGKYFASPVLAGGNVYCVGRDGKVQVVALSETFKVVGEADLGEASHSTPAIVGKTMYLRTVTKLMALGGK